MYLSAWRNLDTLPLGLRSFRSRYLPTKHQVFLEALRDHGGPDASYGQGRALRHRSPQPVALIPLKRIYQDGLSWQKDRPSALDLMLWVAAGKIAMNGASGLLIRSKTLTAS